MLTYEQLLGRSLAQNGIILDACILIVWFAGLYDPTLIGNIPKTSGYDASDFEYIASLVRKASRVIVTPQILTEASNHLFDKLHGTSGEAMHFGRIFGFIESASEHISDKSRLLLHREILAKVGFSDLSIMEAVRELGCVVVTQDGPLTGHLRMQRYCVVNMNEIRSHMAGIAAYNRA